MYFDRLFYRVINDDCYALGYYNRAIWTATNSDYNICYVIKLLIICNVHQIKVSSPNVLIIKTAMLINSDYCTCT